MRRLIIGILFVGFCYFGRQVTFAQCTCSDTYRNITAHKEFQLAAAVFIGKVVKLTKSAPEQGTGNYTETVEFEVTKAWKEELEPRVTIKNRIEGCLNGFEENTDWLVYAYRTESGQLITYCCCSRTTPLSKAAEDLAELAAKGEQPIKIRKPQN
jgi:hypothetical protein